MSRPTSDLLRILTERGFVHQKTDPAGLDAALRAGAVTGYIGFDATADSLHVGSLLPIMMLRWMSATGHKPIALMGGGTTKIGDPSGKDESRQLMTAETIAANIASIAPIFQRMVPGVTMADNAEWLDRLNYVAMLRDVGRHFTINRMLTFDSVKLRLDREQPLTFLEFNYMILQAYDFVELHRRFGCTLQAGGSDQWGNIVSGVDLGRRMAGAELFGLTCPLLTTATGAKMGKSAAGAVWLKAERLSPYEYWQFWRNVDDADVGRFLRLFTELPLDEIARLERLEGAEINHAKAVLADRTTAMLHGEAAAREAAETAHRTFAEGQAGAGLPHVDVPRAELEAGIGVLELFRRAGLVASNAEARRLIQQGGAKVNDRAVTEEATVVRAGDLVDGAVKLSAGKKRHALVRAV